eukprot:scaffold51999_cov72-Phaeocystis_antarctica.AAC.7
MVPEMLSSDPSPSPGPSPSPSPSPKPDPDPNPSPHPHPHQVPEMLKRAKEAARRVGMLGVTSFRLGEIEHLPIGDGVADAVLSNCVLNLCAPMWKPRSAWPAQRRPSGRLAERQAEARGSPRHDLSLKAASGAPAGRV